MKCCLFAFSSQMMSALSEAMWTRSPRGQAGAQALADTTRMLSTPQTNRAKARLARMGSLRVSTVATPNSRAAEQGGVGQAAGRPHFPLVVLLFSVSLRSLGLCEPSSARCCHAVSLSGRDAPGARDADRV